MRHGLIGVALGLVLAGGAVGAEDKPATTRPAVEVQHQGVSSEQVEVNGVGFEAGAMSARWSVPVPDQESFPQLWMTILNRTDKALTFSMFDTLTIELKDAAGKAIALDGGRNATRPAAPVVVEAKKDAIVRRPARLVYSDKGTLRLIGSDGSGGVWYFDGLRPGEYRVSFHYQFKAKDAEAPKAGDGKLPPYWEGEVHTKEITVTIVEPK